ncbi:MAG: helix-turn-helix transcriptional regulator [Caulobacter sp.]|nr:helix-turn-helix transcriptional regulator [Vitreoscilla sp.]
MERAERNEGRRRFGLRLVSVRRRLALTQEALSTDAGISRSYLSGVENGRRNLGLDNIYKLADALGILPLVLLDLDGLTDRAVRHAREPSAAYVAKRPDRSRRGDFLAADSPGGGTVRLSVEELEPPAPPGFEERQGEAPAQQTLEARLQGWIEQAAAERLSGRLQALFPAGLPRRVARHVMRAAILNLLDGEFVTIKELAGALSRATEFLRGDYLRPLVAEGEVALRYPGHPSHPQQAYIATTGRSSPTAS